MSKLQELYAKSKEVAESLSVKEKYTYTIQGLDIELEMAKVTSNEYSRFLKSNIDPETNKLDLSKSYTTVEEFAYFTNNFLFKPGLNELLFSEIDMTVNGFPNMVMFLDCIFNNDISKMLDITTDLLKFSGLYNEPEENGVVTQEDKVTEIKN